MGKMPQKKNKKNPQYKTIKNAHTNIIALQVNSKICREYKIPKKRFYVNSFF